MRKILMVCLGNICRSPMAEAILIKKAQEHNLDIKVDSAGTSGFNKGSNPHEGTLNILLNHNIVYEGETSRKIIKDDFYNFDEIYVMDNSNYEDVMLLKPANSNAQVIKIMSLVNSEFKEVPDPWYCNRFELVYDLLDEACDKIIEKVSNNE